MYTINGNLMHMDRSGNYIMHGAKGSEWKTHKYVDKILKNGKWVYTYAKNKIGSSKLGKEVSNFKNYKSNKKALDKMNRRIKNNQNMANWYDSKYAKLYGKTNPLYNKRDAANKAATNATKSAEKAQYKSDIARIDKDMENYKKYGDLAEKNYKAAKEKTAEANRSHNTASQYYNQKWDAYQKAVKYEGVANNIQNSKEYNNVRNRVESTGGKAAKAVDDTINKLTETKKNVKDTASKAKDTASKAASSVKSKVKEIGDKVSGEEAYDRFQEYNQKAKDALNNLLSAKSPEEKEKASAIRQEYLEKAGEAYKDASKSLGSVIGKFEKTGSSLRLPLTKKKKKR